MLRMLQMPKEGCFAFSDSRPTFEYSPSRGKSPLCFAKQPFGMGHQPGGEEKLFVVADGDFFVLTSELCSARAMHVVAMH